MNILIQCRTSRKPYQPYIDYMQSLIEPGMSGTELLFDFLQKFCRADLAFRLFSVGNTLFLWLTEPGDSRVVFAHKRVTKYLVTLLCLKTLQWERNIHAKYIRECRYFGVLLFGGSSPLYGKSFVLIDRPDLLSLNCTELNSVNQLLLENKKDNRTGQHHI